MITLAPEVCSQEVLSLIHSYGIVISAGHSNASYEESMLAFKNGIGAATHLFNAMSPLHHREPGLVGAIFDHETVMCSIVPDGYHVDFAAIRIAKKIMSLSNDKQVGVVANILEIGGEADLDKGLQKAIDNKDSIGGIIECQVTGLPVGLGEPFFNSAESMISHAVFSIPAVRGIEFGTGFAAAKMFGSEHNDAIENKEGKTRTNHAGGIVGGLTNGNELVFRIAIKPTSSTPKEQTTLNWESGQVETVSIKGRHDLYIAHRVPVVLEAVTAIVLADLLILEQHIPRVIQK